MLNNMQKHAEAGDKTPMLPGGRSMTIFCSLRLLLHLSQFDVIFVAAPTGKQTKASCPGFVTHPC
jgi:hypothetical protein